MDKIADTAMDVLSATESLYTSPIPLYGPTYDPCINASKQNVRPITAGDVDFIIQHYIFPVQFIFGVSGNSLNLLVLLSSSMKNQVCICLLEVFILSLR